MKWQDWESRAESQVRWTQPWIHPQQDVDASQKPHTLFPCLFVLVSRNHSCVCACARSLTLALSQVHVRHPRLACTCCLMWEHAAHPWTGDRALRTSNCSCLFACVCVCEGRVTDKGGHCSLCTVLLSSSLNINRHWQKRIGKPPYHHWHIHSWPIALLLQWWPS